MAERKDFVIKSEKNKEITFPKLISAITQQIKGKNITYIFFFLKLNN